MSNFSPHCLYSLPLEEMDNFGSIPHALTFVSRFLTLWAFPLFSGRILQLKLYTNLLFICMCLWFFCYFQIFLIFFYKWVNVISSHIFLRILVYCGGPGQASVVGCLGACVCLLILNANVHTSQLPAPVFLCLRPFSCLWSPRCCQNRKLEELRNYTPGAALIQWLMGVGV